MQSFYIQDAGGSIKAIAQGVEAGMDLLAQVAAQPREEIPLAELVLATKCGNVDASTLVASNPTLGVVSDMVLDAGGSVVLAETPDLAAAGGSLVRRARDSQVAERLTDLVNRARAAKSPDDGLGAAAGVAPEQVSLGCIEKAGTGVVQDVLRFAERPQGRGLFVMDTPAHDAVAVSAMAAGGAQLCVFTTGRGTPLGNAICPVIKVCGNAETNTLMADNVDFSTVPVADGSAGKDALAADLFGQLLAVCNGQLTNAEIIGHQEFAIHRIGPTV
jgi:altronate dehydratase large subunit